MFVKLTPNLILTENNSTKSSRPFRELKNSSRKEFRFVNGIIKALDTHL
jgi:hypothetical protein